MNIYLDCEWTDFNGELISLALVPENHSIPEFYREIITTKNPCQWVKENVIPHLGMHGESKIDYKQFQTELANYFYNKIYPNMAHSSEYKVNIIADWPEDISTFCKALITGPGERLAVQNFKFELNFNINYVSSVPHHAFYDALGIRNWYESNKKS